MIEDRCTCGIEEHQEHPCHYALEIGNEYDLPEDEWTVCSCCPYCENQCAMDI